MIKPRLCALAGLGILAGECGDIRSSEVVDYSLLVLVV